MNGKVHTTTPPPTCKLFTVIITGPVGAGKSTLLESIRKVLKLEKYKRVGAVFLAEPVSVWKELHALEIFIGDQAEYGLAFQQMTIACRLFPWIFNHAEAKKMAESGEYDTVLSILERSVICDREFFANELHRQKKITDEQMKLYDALWLDVYSKRPANINLFLWINMPAGENYKRVITRANDPSADRAEENGYSEEYLQQVHSAHISALDGKILHGIPVMEINGLLPFNSDIEVSDGIMADVLTKLLAKQ